MNRKSGSLRLLRQLFGLETSRRTELPVVVRPAVDWAAFLVMGDWSGGAEDSGTDGDEDGQAGEERKHIANVD